jgi:hypothetical protein
VTNCSTSRQSIQVCAPYDDLTTRAWLASLLSFSNRRTSKHGPCAPMDLGWHGTCLSFLRRIYHAVEAAPTLAWLVIGDEASMGVSSRQLLPSTSWTMEATSGCTWAHPQVIRRRDMSSGHLPPFVCCNTGLAHSGSRKSCCVWSESQTTEGCAACGERTRPPAAPLMTH